MNRNVFVLLFTLAVAGCSAAHPRGDGKRSYENDSPPQLWSDHRRLEMPVDACAQKAYRALSVLGFTGITQNGYFSYGNFDNNRAAVKCVDDSGGVFVYFAVAGPERNVVENLRNTIARKF